MAVNWLQKVLAHHDPLGAWPPTASSNRDYGLEARLVLHRLRGIQGLSHVRTLLAEALDQLHPGLSGALEQQGELRVRLGRVAQDIRQAKAYRSDTLVRFVGGRVAQLPAGPELDSLGLDASLQRGRRGASMPLPEKSRHLG